MGDWGCWFWILFIFYYHLPYKACTVAPPPGMWPISPLLRTSSGWGVYSQWFCWVFTMSCQNAKTLKAEFGDRLSFVFLKSTLVWPPADQPVQPRTPSRVLYRPSTSYPMVCTPCSSICLPSMLYPKIRPALYCPEVCFLHPFSFVYPPPPGDLMVGSSGNTVALLKKKSLRVAALGGSLHLPVTNITVKTQAPL